MGSDFPPQFKTLIDTWDTKCVFRRDNTRLTTTGWNGYGPNEYRAFKYLTPKLRLDEHSLSNEQVMARSFHMVCSPQRCISIITGVIARRKLLAPDEPRPIFVWEPVPDLCTPEEFERLREAAAIVDVVSPNAEELESFFPSTSHPIPRNEMVARLLGLGSEGALRTALVVREGALGCTTYVDGDMLHLRAFHQTSTRVIDPTGGGNAFLGALAQGLTGIVSETVPEQLAGNRKSLVSQRKNLLLALVHAIIAAGYAIEQVGMPTVSVLEPDTWNGERYQTRFAAYLDREQSHISNQLQ
ncbi:hypothetical protein PV10_00972 [Exophiala mesophila]|uniref:Carbohydrate kinase PfkB domain-containing protein n=1 Tax=Exophiala mesophila TaxID=212818 RepID=A0A0D2AE66_EXOME|nr:uncharacterized protein PV10_00972 [Exophiala mesophila]KIV97193.1 hypothetical protein PV10_00972 [Exophiala mesophila]